MELIVTVHAVEPAAVNEFFVHERALTVAAVVELPDDGLSLRLNDFELEFSVAVNVAVCAVVTADTVAVKLALFEPAATVTEVGIATAVLLLARLTTIPPLGAVPFRLTVHASEPAPIIEVLAQLRLEMEGVPFDPCPCNFTVPETVVEEVLMAVRVNCPAESVSAFGS